MLGDLFIKLITIIASAALIGLTVIAISIIIFVVSTFLIDLFKHLNFKGGK